MVGPLIFFAVLVVLGLSYWLSRSPHDRRYSRNFIAYPDEIQTAAYRFISPPHITPSYLGGKTNQIERVEAHLERRREAAAELNNPELRACVLAYIDYLLAAWLPKKAAELRDQTTKKNNEAYRAQRKEKDAKVKAILKEEGIH